MSKWIYDGYVKVKTGIGRHQRYIEYRRYKCLNCGWSVRIKRTMNPPQYCPKCQKNMTEGEG